MDKEINQDSDECLLRKFSFWLSPTQKFVFGCGVVETNDEKLRRMHETLMLKKLGLSKIFSRSLLHAQKTSLGLRLMKLSAASHILAISFHVRNT